VKPVLRPGLAALALAVVFVTPSPASAAVHAAALPSKDVWLADVTAVTAEAASYLDTRLSGSGGEKTAIVLDIDNTALEAAYAPSLVVPATPPVLTLAQLAAKEGAAVFFVTARPDFLRGWTAFNLSNVGYPSAGLYLKSGFVSDEASKTAARTAIEKLGYTIVANIGNNDTDLAGGHAERTFKLPDYNGQLG
jgi:predicted secreted acid phosphatase